EDGIRDFHVTGVQTCALPIWVGVGGMSVIWRAHDEMLDRLVAVKVLASSLAADARFREWARAEARAAAALDHPSITAVYDYGETDRKSVVEGKSGDPGGRRRM